MMQTASVPRNRLLGMVFFGLITSSEVYVILYQASTANREPTIAMAMAMNKALPDIGTCVPFSGSTTCEALQKSMFSKTEKWVRLAA